VSSKLVGCKKQKEETKSNSSLQCCWKLLWISQCSTHLFSTPKCKSSIKAVSTKSTNTIITCLQLLDGSRRPSSLKCFQEALEFQLSSWWASSVHSAALAQTCSHIGNLCLRKGHAEPMMAAFSESLRLLQCVGKSESDLSMSGFSCCSLSELHPECAAAA
jgi:hypothetical protein